MTEYHREVISDVVGVPYGNIGRADLGYTHHEVPRMSQYSNVPTDYSHSSPTASMEFSPPLTVKVEGLKFAYQFTKDDVRKVFSRYGEVADVFVAEEGDHAVVTFMNFVNTVTAWTDLNGKPLAGIKDAYMRVDCPSLTQPYGPPQTEYGEYDDSYHRNHASNSLRNNNNNNPNLPLTSQPKFTCRIEVGIENEKEFRVGSKVISVARKIWQELPSFQENGGKTRLRGKGVGGPHESDEPLALCISCRESTCFDQAVRFAENQLKKIHQEYTEWCLEKGYADPNLMEPRAVSDHPLNVQPVNDASYQNFVYENSRIDGNTMSTPNRGRRPAGAPSEGDIDLLIEERNEARKAANFSRADEIREYLKDRGVVLIDEKGARGSKKSSQVTKWRYQRAM